MEISSESLDDSERVEASAASDYLRRRYIWAFRRREGGVADNSGAERSFFQLVRGRLQVHPCRGRLTGIIRPVRKSLWGSTCIIHYPPPTVA
jgi:hypothetical protein